MSTFQPDSFAEAKASFKPMKRTRMRHQSSAIPYATNSLKSRKGKKPKPSTLKRKAWTEFSIFIRTRGADEDGFNVCCTCGVRKHWKDLQAGHFIAGRLNSNLFDERGASAQCSLCNVIKAGNGPMYYRFMSKTYGEAVIEELLQQNNQTRKWKPGELEGLFEKYKALNEANPNYSRK